MRAPSLPAPGSCRGQSSEGPFPDQLSFEFRQSREEREDQLSAGRRRVDELPIAVMTLAWANSAQRQSAIWRRMLASPFLGNTVPRSRGDNSCPEDQVQKSGDKQKPFEDLPHNEFQSRMIQLPMSSLGLQELGQVAS